MRGTMIAALLLLIAPPIWGESLEPPAPIDSIVPLPAVRPVDPEAGIRLTPHAIALDPLSRPWILDRVRGRVLVLSGRSGMGRSVSIASVSGSDAFPYADIAASGSYLFLLDPSSPSLTLLDLDGYVRETVDLAAEIEAAGETGFSATRLLVGRSGDLWLIDPRGGVLRFDRRGRFLEAPLEGLAGRDRPKRIADAALAPDDGIVLLDPARPSLVTLPAAGGPRPPILLASGLAEPAALAVDKDGTSYLVDASGRIRVIDAGGLVLYDGTLGNGKEIALGRACITSDGILLRADPAGGTISRWRIVRAAPEDEDR